MLRFKCGAVSVTSVEHSGLTHIGKNNRTPHSSDMEYRRLTPTDSMTITTSGVLTTNPLCVKIVQILDRADEKHFR